ncbi:MAG: iron-containing alcohol dehydrogenase, partial [Oscillospiraceae bacterium]|nr:iron-containing alcohol dehydrogenase [Oscillospiraceae bacterium]
THKKVGEIIAGYGFKKILLVYGGGSIKTTGLYDSVVDSLYTAGIEFVELAGVEPNPKLSMVLKGAEICRLNAVELVLAVGGGSAIDMAKVTAAAAVNDCDPWLFSMKKANPGKALPVATILTLAASGSEMSASAVITNEEKQLKRGYNSDFNRPLFSILNPELTFTLPPYQTACGVVDIMMHTLERYLTKHGDAEPTDMIAEAILKTTINAGKIAMANPCDYDARAQLMWAGSLSHNDLANAGRLFFMVSHQIEHELSGMFDSIAHGAGLAVVFPAWAQYAYKYDVAKFARYAVNVWNIDYDYSNPEATAVAGINATREFFKSIGMPVTLGELNVPESSFEEMAVKCTNFGERTLDGFIQYGKDEIIEILKLGM